MSRRLALVPLFHRRPHRHRPRRLYRGGLVLVPDRSDQLQGADEHGVPAARRRRGHEPALRGRAHGPVGRRQLEHHGHPPRGRLRLRLRGQRRPVREPRGLRPQPRRRPRLELLQRSGAQELGLRRPVRQGQRLLRPLAQPAALPRAHGVAAVGQRGDDELVHGHRPGHRRGRGHGDCPGERQGALRADRDAGAVEADGPAHAAADCRRHAGDVRLRRLAPARPR